MHGRGGLRNFADVKRYALLLCAAISTALCLRAEEAPDTVLMLGEVSVTAVKTGAYALSLQPGALTIVGAGEVSRLNILTMRDVSEVSPNFYIPEYGSRMTSTIYMRGIGARIDQPVVGLNVDNVPYLNKDNYDFDLQDIERIDVLRGPQSTLYGRNTMGGQINITTLSPMRFQGLRMMAELSSGLTERVSLGYYTRLSPSLATAITGYFNHCDGFYTNEHDGSNVGRENAGSVRWKTVWAPSAPTIVENTASYAITRQKGYPYESLETGRIDYNDPCYYHRWSLNDGLTVRTQTRHFSVTSITSVQYLDDDMTLDQDFLPLSYFTLTQKRHELALTQDVIFSGRTGRYSWLGGAFAFYKRQRMSAPVTFKPDGIEGLIVSRLNSINPTYPIVWSEDEFTLNSDFTNPVYGLAAYHRSTLELGRWTIEADLRFDYEHNSLRYHSHCATAYDILDLSDPANPGIYRHDPVNIDDTGHLHRSFTQLLPKVAVTYRLPDRWGGIAYASVARGYKAGGFNTQMFSDVLQQRMMGLMGLSMQYDVSQIISYKPEHSWNYEVGLNLAPSPDNSFSLSLFYIDCRDQQLTMFPDGTTTGRIMANAGKTRSLGFEVAGKYQVSAPLSVQASYGFCDARFVDFDNGIRSYDDKRVPYAPQNTLFAAAVYTLGLPGGCSLLFDVNVRGVGSIYWDEENTVRQPFYAQLGASVTFTRGDLGVKLWGENLTDTDFTTFYFVSVGNAFLQRGAPARLGLKLTYNL